MPRPASRMAYVSASGTAAVSEEELAEEIAEAELPPETPAAEAPVPELPVTPPESGEAD
jgi:exoribonuclease II